MLLIKVVVVEVKDDGLYVSFEGKKAPAEASKRRLSQGNNQPTEQRNEKNISTKRTKA
jgi:hypothetical protein